MNRDNYTYETLSNEEYFALKKKFEDSGSDNYHVYEFRNKGIVPDFDIPMILDYFEFIDPDYEAVRIFCADKGVILETRKKESV